MSFFEHPIVFCRHGQTQWNLEKRTMGQLNSPLTKLGRQQAKALAGKLKNYNINIIVSSPLKRALDTAEIIGKELRIGKIDTEGNFSERNLGVLQAITNEQAREEYAFLFDQQGNFKYGSHPPAGEKAEDFVLRVRKGLEALAGKEKVLVVSHDGVLNAVYSIVKGIPFNEVPKRYRFTFADIVIV